eukprot:7350667-Alexandrium_andersonii.AAC.1
MSASLVGSEMCIRDRRGWDRNASTQRSPSRCRRVRPRAREAAGASGRPVSYTHLTLPTICSV